MPGQRQDYILRQIDLLRQFVSRLVRTKEGAGLEDMLQLSFSLQEKLFAMPPADFLQLDVSEQIAALKKNEPDDAGREKCLTYATLLKETAALYEFRSRDDLAFGARQLALHVALATVLNPPKTDDTTHALLEELQASVAGHALHPPVQELLDEYQRSVSSNS
jgi:hypothetical protein